MHYHLIDTSVVCYNMTNSLAPVTFNSSAETIKQAVNCSVSTLDLKGNSGDQILWLGDGGDYFRCGLLPSYKGNRKPKPDHYHEILDAVTEFANPIFLRTYEADDLIALFSVYLSKLGHTSTIHTVDGDLMQLITPSCTWSSLAHWAPMVRSIDNWQEWFAKRKIAKKYWVAANTPHHAMSLYKYGLGDSSDNYPKHSDPLIWDLLVSPIFDEKLDMPGLLEIHSRHVNLNTGMQAKELLLRSGCSLPYHVEEIGW